MEVVIDHRQSTITSGMAVGTFHTQSEALPHGWWSIGIDL